MSDCFRINGGLRQGCIMSPWLFNVYMDALMKDENGIDRMGEVRLPGLLYADDLLLYGESEQHLKVMEGHFIEVCRMRGLKFNPDKSGVMVLGGEDGLECEIHVNVT